MNVEAVGWLRAVAERGMQAISHASSHMPSGKQATFMQGFVDQTKEDLAGAHDVTAAVVPLTEEACKEVASRFVAEFDIPTGGKGYMMDDDPDMKKIEDMAITIGHLTQVGLAALPHLERSPGIAAMLSDEIKGVVQRTNRICGRPDIQPAEGSLVSYYMLVEYDFGWHKGDLK